jgi:DNA primase
VIEQLYTLKKKVDQRDREIQALIEYQKRTSQREYERAKQDLESRLAASKDDMDVEGVAHYTRELTRLQDMETHENTQQQQSLQRQAQEQFIERNAHWFNDRNPDLKARAIEIDNELKSIYPNATYEELALKIETRMQYEHPERVLGAARRATPAVSPGQSSVNKTAVKSTSVTRTFQNLSQDLKDAYSATKRIVESRGDKEYSISDFIEQLKKDGEL